MLDPPDVGLFVLQKNENTQRDLHFKALPLHLFLYYYLILSGPIKGCDYLFKHVFCISYFLEI